MLILLYNRSGGITANRLAKAIGITPRKNKVSRNDIVVVRWGSSRPVPGIDKAINSANSIALAAHGSRSLMALSDAGIPAVQIVVPDNNPETYPVVGRKFYHRAGLDIVMCHCFNDVVKSRRAYYTKFVVTDQEFRVHVFNGKVIKIMRKVPRVNDPNLQIRTSRHGWGYTRVGLGNYKMGQHIAVEAVKALGLTFGGVDLGLNKETGEYTVFEVNTAPSLNSLSLEIYAEELINYITDLGVGYEHG